MNPENTPDPGHHADALHFAEEQARLLMINARKASIRVAGAEMRKGIDYPMALELFGQGSNRVSASKQAPVLIVGVEPMIMAKPTVLQPDPIGSPVMRAVPDGCAGFPDVIGHPTEDSSAETEKKEHLPQSPVGRALLVAFCVRYHGSNHWHALILEEILPLVLCQD